MLTATGDSVVRKRLFNGERLVSPAYQKTMDFLSTGDAVWGACEVQFSERGFRTDSLVAYKVDPVVAEDLGRVGFDAMTVATNHTWDFGPDAFMDTLENLRAAGIRPVGGGKTLDQALQPLTMEANGVRVGVLAVSCLLPPYYAATSERPGIAPLRVHQHQEIDPLRMMIEPGGPIPVRSRVDEDDFDEISTRIERLGSQVDCVVVSVHWGYGQGEPLAEYQRPLGRALIDQGADLVLGNHMHSPHGVEVHNGKPIMYGLGNHIAQQDREHATPVQRAIFADIDPWSAMARITFGRDGVETIEFVATECDGNGLPIPIGDAEAAAPILTRIGRLCEKLGNSHFQVDGERGVLQL